MKKHYAVFNLTTKNAESESDTSVKMELEHYGGFESEEIAQEYISKRHKQKGQWFIILPVYEPI